MNRRPFWDLLSILSLAPYLDVWFIPHRQLCLPEVAHSGFALFFGCERFICAAAIHKDRSPSSVCDR